MSAVLAPAGWGFIPGAPITPLTYDDLPDMPLLQVLSGAKRNEAVLEMILAHPHRSEFEPRHLVRKYGIPQSTASVIVQRSKLVHP